MRLLLFVCCLLYLYFIAPTPADNSTEVNPRLGRFRRYLWVNVTNLRFDSRYDCGFRLGRWYFIRVGRRPRIYNRPGRTSTRLPSTMSGTTNEPASDSTTAASEPGSSETPPQAKAKTSNHKGITHKPEPRKQTVKYQQKSPSGGPKVVQPKEN